jgi:hypothetical protein
MSQACRKRISEMFTLDQMGECFGKYLSKTIEIKKRDVFKPVRELEKQSIIREIQNIVEYFQVKQEFWRLTQEARRLDQEVQGLSSDIRELNQKYTDLNATYLSLLQPKPPSHWFYLWIRQLLLPVYNWISRTKLLGLLTRLKRTIKHRLVKDS